MLPGFLDAINWSIPFIIEKVMQMTAAILESNVGSGPLDIELTQEYA